MGSPYQLILLNLIHHQGILIGMTDVLLTLRRLAVWRPAMLDWRKEQERQLKTLLVLFKKIGGDYGRLHRWMLELARYCGWAAGLVMTFMPVSWCRIYLRQMDRILIGGLERAGAQIAIADWAEWGMDASASPPKALLELSASRREWPSRWAGHAQFL